MGGFCYCNDGCGLCDPDMSQPCPNCAELQEQIDILREQLRAFEPTKSEGEK